MASPKTSQRGLGWKFSSFGALVVATDDVHRKWRRRRRRLRSGLPLPLATIIIVLLTCVRVGMVAAVCPNMCSGHGECRPENKCECEEDWDVVADCSLKSCPTGVSWGSKVCQGRSTRSVYWLFYTAGQRKASFFALSRPAVHDILCGSSPFSAS